jgi:O-acetyl-ADP-ribose deacetylase (regulator of RNase III)
VAAITSRADFEVSASDSEDDDAREWACAARQMLRAVFVAFPADLTPALPEPLIAGYERILAWELEVAEVEGQVADVERDFRPLLIDPADSAGGSAADAAYPIVVWRGDMSRLRVDAMVNPANAALVGCFLPAHTSLDNILHAQAGIRLRAECHAMFAREAIDPVAGDANGRCRVTPACALPALWVLHTIGPDLTSSKNGDLQSDVKGADSSMELRSPTEVDRADLTSCYRECYRTALRLGARSIAFPCISTGVFGYPQEEAVQVALKTIKAEIDASRGTPDLPPPLVVFNVFTSADLCLYREAVLDGFPTTSVPIVGNLTKWRI